jgi:hypothetical protein
MEENRSRRLQICVQKPQPVFVNLLWSQGIDSQPARPCSASLYLSYRPARLHKLVGSIPWNQFLYSLDVYKYGLCSDRGGGGRSNTSPTHQHPISKLIRGYLILRRFNRYSPPQCFLYKYREACILKCGVY